MPADSQFPRGLPVDARLLGRHHASMTTGAKLMVAQFLRVFCIVAALASVASPSAAGVIGFDSLADGELVTNQFSGVLFSNTTTLTAGISLNEFEFPPHSGTNVVFDDGGPISVDFATAVARFSGFFTYSRPITLSAFDATHVLLGSISSAFFSNLALSGIVGSSPNEFLQISSLAGITSVTITGASSGGSFVLDDVTTQALQGPNPPPRPEPGTVGVLLVGLAGARRFALARKWSR